MRARRVERARSVRGLAALGVSLALCAPVAARAGDEPQVAPDRPSVSTSTQTVAPGGVQLETGIQYSSTSQAAAPDAREFAVQATLRIGLTPWLEARVEGEPLVRLRGDEQDTGFGDLSLGVKWRFLDQTEGSAWPSLGVEPFLKLATANPPVGSGRTDFGATGLASWDLPLGLHVDANAGVAAIGQSDPGGFIVQATASASLSKNVARGLSTYVELFFNSPAVRGDRSSLGFDTGATYIMTRRIAVDAAVGTALTGRAPDYVVRTGVSVLFGR
jgi:hypothetical protein